MERTLEELLGDEWMVDDLTKLGTRWYAEVHRIRYEWGEWKEDGGAADAEDIFGAISGAIEDALKRAPYPTDSYNLPSEKG